MSTMTSGNNNNNPTNTMATSASALQQQPSTVVVKSSSSSSTSSGAASTVPLTTRLVLSAFAGMGAATMCHPLDVIRVQMQTGGGGGGTALQAAQRIYQTTGLVNGLYAGISAAYLRQWMYGSVRMGLYAYLLERQKMQNVAVGREALDISFGHKLAMGAVAGAVGSFVGTPSEVALVRMSNDSKLAAAERRNYGNVVNCLVRIASDEGPTALWRGATPTVVRATLLGSFQMGVTTEAKGRLSASGWFGENGQWLGGYPMMFCATLVASFVANIAANPFDVLKSRLQNQKIAANGTAQYRGMMDCLVQSVRAEGPLVLYAGFGPAFIKLAPYSIISLTLADKLTKAVTGKDAM